MKTALVLGGGGTKGSYQIGVLRALRQLDIKFDIITGTSIGSINGAIYCQSEFDDIEQIWSNISKKSIFKGFDQINLEELNLNPTNLIANVKSQVGKPALDITPFKELIATTLDEDKLRNSKIDYGLVCVSFPSMKPIEIALKDIPYGKVNEYILASCSLFPAFPLCKIEDKMHVDGGYYDNVPINLAINMGATDIIAVDLFFRPYHPHYQYSPYVKYIKTSWPLNAMLSFDKKAISRNINLGYNDTLKAYGKILGFRYSFKKTHSKNFDLLAEKYSRKIFLFESIDPAQRIVVKQIIAHPLSSTIREFTLNKSLTKSEIFIRGLEITLELLRYSPLKIYSIENINKELISMFKDKEKYNFNELFKNILPTNAKIGTGIDTKYLIGCILYKLLSIDEYTVDIIWLATIFPKETTSAFYLYSIIKH